MNALPPSARLQILFELCDYVAAGSAAPSGQQPEPAHNRVAGQTAPRSVKAVLPLGMPAGVSCAPAGAVRVDGGARASMTSNVTEQSAQRDRANEALIFGR